MPRDAGPKQRAPQRGETLAKGAVCMAVLVPSTVGPEPIGKCRDTADLDMALS